MPKKRLTKTIIDHAKYEGKGRSQYILWDTKVPGLGLRIQPSGYKSFVIFYRNEANQQKFMSIGKYGIITLDQARSTAKIELSKVEQGQDPSALKTQKSRGETLEAFSKSFIVEYAKPNKKTWKEDDRYFKQYILPNLGKKKLKQIDRETVYRLHQTLKDSHSVYVANRSLALISTLFNKAIEWGAVPNNQVNPAQNIKKFKEKKRDRWLTEEELIRLNKALTEEENLYAKSAILFFLFTGIRKSELLKAKWDDIKNYGDHCELYLPDTKSGESQYVSLSSAALKLLSTIPRIKDNPYIFVGSKPGHHLVNIRKAWVRIRSRAGIEDARIHDLRRTLGSRMIQSGASLKLVKETLRHKDLKTTEIYARIADSQKRDALEVQGSSLGETFSDYFEADK